MLCFRKYLSQTGRLFSASLTFCQNIHNLEVERVTLTYIRGLRSMLGGMIVKTKNFFFPILIVLIISSLALAAIDLTDPTQTGSYTPSPAPVLGNRYVEGTVYTTSGQPLRNGKIYISVGTKIYETYSDVQGFFRLSLPLGELPKMIVLQVEKEGYVPDHRVYYSSSLGQERYTFQLSPVTSNYILIDPKLHHLGDDLYSGIANSQFQLPTEGTKYQTTFNLPIPPGQIERAILRITVKGAEENNPIEINGKRVGYLRLNNNFGNSGEWQAEIPVNTLRSGSNTLTISSYYYKDYDDFEFSNIRLELITKKMSNPPLIEVHEPTDGTQITSFDSPARINLRATVSAENNLSYVSINGKTLGGIYGRYAGISEYVELYPGNNTITIEAADIYGQTTRKAINVTLLTYPSFSYDLVELFSLSWLGEHQSAMRYLQNYERMQNTAIVYYPMWGERYFHDSFVERYRFLEANKLELPSLFLDGQIKVTDFTAYRRGFTSTKPINFIASYKDTSTYTKTSGRLYIDYVPLTVGKDLTVHLTLAEATTSNRFFLEAREVFSYNIRRSYQPSTQRLDVPVSFSSRRGDYRYVLTIHDSNSKELLYCTIF